MDTPMTPDEPLDDLAPDGEVEPADMVAELAEASTEDFGSEELPPVEIPPLDDPMAVLEPVAKVVPKVATGTSTPFEIVERPSDLIAKRQKSNKGAGFILLLMIIIGIGLIAFAVVRFLQDDGDTTSATTQVTVPVTTAPATTAGGGALTIAGETAVVVRDSTDLVEIAIPESWSDIGGEGWVVDGDTVGVAISAAPDRDAWRTTWGTAGIVLGVDRTGAGTAVFGDFGGSCVFEGTESVSTGEAEVWSNCGDEGSFFLEAVVTGPTGEPALLQLVTFVDPLPVANELLATLRTVS